MTESRALMSLIAQGNISWIRVHAVMANNVRIQCPQTGDVVVLRPYEDNTVRVTRGQEVASRFGLKMGEFKIFQESGEGVSICAESEGIGDEREWHLKCGMSYVLYREAYTSPVQVSSHMSEERLSSDRLKIVDESSPVQVSSHRQRIAHDQNPVHASSHKSGERLSSHTQKIVDESPAHPSSCTYNGVFESPEHVSTCTQNSAWRDVEKDEFLVSVVDDMLKGKGSSRCVQAAYKILREKNPLRVDHLPEVYDGDCVFELPPFRGQYSKGCFFLGMERRNDCYLWSKMSLTGAQIGPKLNKIAHTYKIQNVKCMGSLQCQHDDCPRFERTQVRNSTEWRRDRAGRNEVPFHAGREVPADSVICGFCERPPRCIGRCPAEMYYITPHPQTELNKYQHMSRVAMHVDKHTHPPKFTHKKGQREVVRNLMEEQIKNSPNAIPSVIRSDTIKALQEIFEAKVVRMMTTQEVKDLDETLAILADDSIMRSMIKSIKQYKHNSSDLSMILELRKKTVFPFVQSVLFPGQNLGTDDRPHVMKMSTKGPGSGVDLVRRMQAGGDLENSWVMSDIMHRMTDNTWCTMSAHVYDHLYRGLCTIFVCELVSQDTEALQTAWRAMKRVCAENGIEQVEFSGFIADNAAAGWNAIRNEFWGGKVNPRRERSDAFHWAQSVEKVTKNYIHPDKRLEHKDLLDSLRDAGNVVLAFRTFERIKAWWMDGNALPGKEKHLSTWLSWWIVRFSQWGNFIRLVRFLLRFCNLIIVAFVMSARSPTLVLSGRGSPRLRCGQSW